MFIFHLKRRQLFFNVSFYQFQFAFVQLFHQSQHCAQDVLVAVGVGRLLTHVAGVVHVAGHVLVVYGGV